MKSYFDAMDCLGAVDYSSEQFGPLSPAQLADLNRKLTPEEAAAVNEYQSKQADEMQAKEEAKPFVDPKTGKTTFVKTTYEAGKPEIPAPHPIVVWQVVIAGVGVLLAGVGIYFASSNHKYQVQLMRAKTA